MPGVQGGELQDLEGEEGALAESWGGCGESVIIHEKHTPYHSASE